jgi:hypothetical protein
MIHQQDLELFQHLDVKQMDHYTHPQPSPFHLRSNPHRSVDRRSTHIFAQHNPWTLRQPQSTIHFDIPRSIVWIRRFKMWTSSMTYLRANKMKTLTPKEYK